MKMNSLGDGNVNDPCQGWEGRSDFFFCKACGGGSYLSTIGKLTMLTIAILDQVLAAETGVHPSINRKEFQSAAPVRNPCFPKVVPTRKIDSMNNMRRSIVRRHVVVPDRHRQLPM